MAEMYYAKTKFLWIKYQDIEPVSGFSQGIREINEKIVSGLHSEYRTKDYYIEWLAMQQPEKFMTCRPYEPRPSCEVETYEYQPNKLFSVSIRFHAKFLKQLPEMLRAVDAKINTFVVKTYPATFQKNN